MDLFHDEVFNSNDSGSKVAVGRKDTVEGENETRPSEVF
jgi:hypothetical protein